MKKNVLALSITAALAGLGFSGGAQAITSIITGNAGGLALSADGVGHSLVVPYYSAQGSNNTLINITNTDTANGKAVKVRFRGASNSDDVYDFQVFLSPGDVWTANVSKGTDGRAQLTTTDKSCTKPANVNGSFVTARLDPKLAAADLANHTREGYVEIFNMADIQPNSSLADEVFHVAGVPACKGTSWTALDTNSASYEGLTFPTTGLMSNWIVINVADAGAWSGEATAVYAYGALGAPMNGNLVYWPQTSVAVGASNIGAFTADPLLTMQGTVAPVIAAAYYDLPDMSTPYTPVATTPALQASALSHSIATTTVMNEYLTNSAINSTTDWTLSMPTRRYSVALDYSSTAGTRVYTALAPWAFFTSANTTVVNRQICVLGMSPLSYDQEEGTPTDPSAVVISPSTPGAPIVFCGEANVLAVNNGGAAASGTLKATVARSNYDNAYSAGWLSISTPGATGGGLPVLGSAFVRATAPTGTFGVTWNHRTNRTVELYP